jgi:hypothetical protein
MNHNGTTDAGDAICLLYALIGVDCNELE